MPIERDERSNRLLRVAECEQKSPIRFPEAVAASGPCGIVLGMLRTTGMAWALEATVGEACCADRAP